METIKRLQGKAAIVTGGSRGIGRSISLTLAKSGASVALTYHMNKALADKVVHEIISAGGSALSLHMECGSRDSIRGAIEEAGKNFGPIAILVNNAAMAQEKPFDTINDSDWDRMLQVNLKGPFICCQETLPGMIRAQWGRIINITSIGGQWGGFNQVHYAAAKAGLINLTRSLAKIYSKDGITTNAVAPGLVQTDMIAHELQTAAGQEKARAIPVGRLASCEEVAGVVDFLAGEEAGYITGQTINVNGGMYFG